MNVRPTILCPVDFSDASATALRYAAAVASHFATRLIVLCVEDPLITEAVDLGTGIVWSAEQSKHQMEQFAAATFGEESSTLAMVEYEVAVGKPAAEILRVSRERSCELIVMSTHGRSGLRRALHGSVAESVLRRTRTPILLVSPGGAVDSARARRQPASRHLIEQPTLGRCGPGTSSPARTCSIAFRSDSPVTGTPLCGREPSNSPR